MEWVEHMTEYKPFIMIALEGCAAPAPLVTPVVLLWFTIWWYVMKEEGEENCDNDIKDMYVLICGTIMCNGWPSQVARFGSVTHKYV